MYKKIVFFLLASCFFISPSLASEMEPYSERLSGKVIPEKHYHLFFDLVLKGGHLGRPVLESFDPGKKPLSFKKIVQKQKKRINQDYQNAVKGLGEILKDFDIRDKKTLKRILENFYGESSREERSEILQDWLSEEADKKDRAKNYFHEFIKTIEDRYVIPDSNSQKRKVINLFYEIIESETVGRKEIRLFRKVLSKLGLPAHNHQDEFLRLYLIEFKEQQIKLEDSPEFRFRDAEVLKLVERTKVYFDDYHFKNLQEMTRFKNILKGFSAQYILFQAAIGAMIYRENITDPLLYDAHTKPGYLQEFASQSLTPTSIISFFIFIVVSQKTNYLFYKSGRHFDKKFLRTMAPHAGLASGFFVSALATELYQDMDFRRCVSSFRSKVKEEEKNKHISSCEKSYAKWIQSKWSDYAVDIVALLGASWISHKIIQAVLIGIRATSTGGMWLSRLSMKIGARMSGWIGFFVTIYAFMEVHQLLEKYIGKSVKSHFKELRIQENLFKLNRLQSQKQSLNHLSEEESAFLKEKIINKIKLIGRQFNDWSLLKSQDYQWSFSLWLKSTNKVTLFYQQSRELLVNLYNQSVSSYDFIVGIVSAQRAEPQNNKGFFIDRDVFDGNREHYSELICSDEWIQKEEIVTTWKRFCDNPKEADLNDEDLISLAYETTFLLFELLNSSESHFDFLPYLGEKPEELFSSNPSYFLGKLNKQEQMELVRSVLKAIYTSGDSVIYQILLERGFESVCSEETSSSEDYAFCMSDAYYKLRDKMLAFAVYVLKEQMSQPFELMHASNLSVNLLRQEDLQRVLEGNKFKKIESLLELLKVYKKGEKFFNLQAESYQFFKEEIEQNGITGEPEVEQIKEYPYLFFQSIVCGLNEKKDFFIIPHLFEELSYVCKKTSPMAKNSKWFYKTLFSRPIESRSKRYANLWLLLEDHVRTHFQSSEDLLEFFEEKSERQIKEISSKNLEDLDRLNKNYLLPNMVNSEVKSLKSCGKIADRYTEKNLGRIDLKGLEVSLFQVIYWLNHLEKQYSKLSSKCKIIELLKSYHDRYTEKDLNSYVYVPQKEEMLELHQKIIEKDLSVLSEMGFDRDGPVLLKPEILLSLVLKESPYFLSEDQASFAPFLMNIIIGQLQGNAKISKDYDEVEYSLLFELKLSLDNFFQQLNFLRMKEGMKKRLQH